MDCGVELPLRLPGGGGPIGATLPEQISRPVHELLDLQPIGGQVGDEDGLVGSDGHAGAVTNDDECGQGDEVEPEAASDRLFSLPLYPGLSDADIRDAVAAVVLQGNVPLVRHIGPVGVQGREF